jgi:hypothetical protein
MRQIERKAGQKGGHTRIDGREGEVAIDYNNYAKQENLMK